MALTFSSATGNISEPLEVTSQTEKDAGSSDSTTPKQKIRRACKAMTSAGQPCRAAATEAGVCFFHGNPEKAAELGRIGGRKNHRSVAELEPLPKMDSAAAICKSIAQLAEEVHAGRVDPKIALTLNQLARLLLHALPAADLEKQRNEMQLPDDFWMPNFSTEHKKEETTNDKKPQEA